MENENNNKLNKIISFIFYFIIVLILLFGVYLRARLYFSKAPFWLDEIMLGLSFTDRNILGMFTPLEANQKAPPLFLAITFVIVKLFGFNEYSFRLLPFSSGILSLFFYYFLLKDYIKNKIGIIIGLFMFSVCVSLVYYSAEFKPYSCDVLISIILLLLYKYINLNNLSVKKITIYSLISFILVFLSFPSMFIITGMVLTKFIAAKKINYKALWILFSILIAGLILFFYDLKIFNFLQNYWCSEQQKGCLELNFSFIFDYIKNNCIYFMFDDNYKKEFLLLLLIFLGFRFLFIDKREKAIMILIIIFLAIIASFMKLYPFKERLMLYLMPVFILLIVKNYDLSIYISKFKKVQYFFNIFISLILMLIIGIKIPYFNLPSEKLIDYRTKFDRIRSEEIRENKRNLTFELIKNFKEGDKILTSEGFYYFIRYYNKYYKFNKKMDIYTYGKIKMSKVNNFTEEFIDKNKNSNLWILGRDDETYFRCSGYNDLINILNSKKIRFEKKRYKQLYLIYLFK